MTTRNLVPRASNEGKLGTSTKKWADVFATNGSFSTLKISSLKLDSEIDLDLFVSGSGIETITANNDGQFVIALDNSFLDYLGFDADGTKSEFTVEQNSIISADDNLVSAIQKLDVAVRDIAAPSNLTVASFDNSIIITSTENFADNDATLMTSAAIDDRILSYGFTTNIGDITSVTAGTGLDIDGGDGDSGDVTIKLSDTTVAAGSYGSATAVPTFTVDAQGRLTAAGIQEISTSFTISDNQGDPNIDTFNNGGTLTFAGGIGLTSTVGDNSVTFDITNTGVADGSYGSATQVSKFTVNEQGQLTSAENVVISIPHGSVSDWNEAVQDVVGLQFTGGTHAGISVAYDDVGDGAIDLSISDNGVTASKLNDDIISGQEELAAGLAATDELLVSDTGTIKRMNVSVLQTYMQDNLTFTTNTDVDVSKANLLTRLASYDSNDTLNIGDENNNTSVVIRGNLTVKGTTTTVDSTTVNIQNAFVFEGEIDNEFETTLTTIDPTADRSITLPNQSGSILVLDSSTAEADKNTAVTATPSEINLLDGSIADTVVDSKAVIYSNTGNVRATSFTGPLIGNVTGSVSGNAATATKLENAINIGGVQFDGSVSIDLPGVNSEGNQNTTGNAATATEATNITATANNTTNETVYLTFVNGPTGTQGIETDTGLTYNPSTGLVTSASFAGSLIGNSDTSTKWSSAKIITFASGDVTGSFSIDGSANVDNVSLTIGDQKVTNAMLADGAVGADELAADAVVNASIAANAAIDLDKLNWTSEEAVLEDFAQDDKLFIYDTDATAIKSMTLSKLEDAIFGNVTGHIEIAAAGQATIKNGIVTNAMLAGSITNDKLVNSSINFGGISLALGGSDATPAFNLSDATNYPTTSLVGTITNAQLAGSISDDKLSQITTPDKVALSAIDINGAIALDNAIIATDLLIIDDGANGTNRKASFDNVVTFLQNNTSLTSLNQLATVGTITSGVWQGTAIADAYVANDLTISGGMIDSSPIGTVTPAAGTFTTLVGNTSLTINDTTTVSKILDEDNMASNSATALATQQSIKAYVDAQITAQDLDIQGDLGGALSIDLDSETLTIAGGTGINTSGADSTITVSIDDTVTTLAGMQTLTNKTLTSPIVSGLTLSDSFIIFEGATANDFETILSVTDPTADRTITLPDATDTLVGRATTDTLTNKSIDADNNTITNLEVDNLKSGVLDTDLSAVAADHTTLASAKAIKAYVDGQLGRFGGIFLTSYNGDSDEYDVVFDSSPLVRSHFGPFAFDLGQLYTTGGSDIIFYGARATGASDRHFLVVGSGDDVGDTKFTGADANTP